MLGNSIDDILIWNQKMLRFEDPEIFGKLPVLFEPNFLIFKGRYGQIIKMDFMLVSGLWKKGDLIVKKLN